MTEGSEQFFDRKSLRKGQISQKEESPEKQEKDHPEKIVSKEQKDSLLHGQSVEFRLSGTTYLMQR
jgi:hypothetical protein